MCSVSVKNLTYFQQFDIGTAADSLISRHNGMKFTTKDADHDNRKNENCARMFLGGWWYNDCHDSNLNGFYYQGKHSSFADGVNWRHWKGHNYSMKKTTMKIK
jgi:ficolin